MMVRKGSGESFRELLPGIAMQPLCYGKATMMCQFRLAAGSSLPLHDHPHEQIGYLLSGRIRLTVDGQTWEVRPGDSWCIAGGTVHGAVIEEDAVAIEVFSPVREDYLP